MRSFKQQLKIINGVFCKEYFAIRKAKQNKIENQEKSYFKRVIKSFPSNLN